MCKLPLRGKPEDYLTTNKKDASKVLDRQVNLYQGEEETRAMIVKAMTKFFDTGHFCFISLFTQTYNIYASILSKVSAAF